MATDYDMTRDQLIRRFLFRAKWYARRWFERQEDFTLDEVLSTCYIGYIKAIDTLRPESRTFFKWLNMNMRAAMIEEHRAAAKWRSHRCELESKHLARHAGDVVDAMIEREDIDRLVSFLGNLPARNQRILLSRLNGASSSEVATEYGVTRSRIHQIEQRCLDDIRQAESRLNPRDPSGEYAPDEMRTLFAVSGLSTEAYSLLKAIKSGTRVLYFPSRNSRPDMYCRPGGLECSAAARELIEAGLVSFQRLNDAGDCELHLQIIVRRLL